MKAEEISGATSKKQHRAWRKRWRRGAGGGKAARRGVSKSARIGEAWRNRRKISASITTQRKASAAMAAVIKISA
jgi:hypothetical protein